MKNTVRTESFSFELVAGLSATEVCARLVAGQRVRGRANRLVGFYLEEMRAHRHFLARGYVSTAHYAELELDISQRRCADLIRVARNLKELPLVDAAFDRGEINWTKASLLACAITSATQEDWLEVAQRSTTKELQYALAQQRGGRPPKPGEELDNPVLYYQAHPYLSATEIGRAHV